MIVYLNGEYIDSGQARISVNDRGYLFGDGLYEMILSYNGKPFRIDRHLARLGRGCEFIRLNLKNVDFIADVCLELIELNSLSSNIASIYIQLTRGSYRRAHKFPPPDIAPTIYVSATEFLPNREHQEKGITTITVQDKRWGRCDIKTIDLLPNVLAHQKAIEAGGQEAIFSKDGIILEGTHSNVFAVIEGEVRTHPLTQKVLPGINRETVLEICAKQNIRANEKPISICDLGNADEVFITSTTLEIMPVIKIDSLIINQGRPGEITRFLQKEFRILTEQDS
jgi:D-alanine transaminase